MTPTPQEAMRQEFEASDLSTFRQGNWPHPDGIGRIVGWIIPNEAVERMGADAYCLPREIDEALTQLAALRAQPEAVQDEWIAVTDHKPEPGVTVLACYRNSMQNLRRIRAIWIPAKFEEADPEQDNVEFDEEKDCYFTPEGWYEQIDNWGDYTAVAVCEGEVEFWRAMPAFPLAGGK